MPLKNYVPALKFSTSESPEALQIDLEAFKASHWLRRTHPTCPLKSYAESMKSKF
jgi:hypothetical protein